MEKQIGEYMRLKANQSFAIINPPAPCKQHPNQQAGLDLYITVLNIDTGEICFKKLYKNSKGLYFKHTGYPPQYFEQYTDTITYIPYQILR